MGETSLTSVHLRNFTVFEDVTIEFVPGLNLLLGVNGTGKTHLLKVLYAAAESMRPDLSFSAELTSVFESSLKQLTRNGKKANPSDVAIKREDQEEIGCGFGPSTVSCQPSESWTHPGMTATYIPVKEILAHAAGFLSTVARREMAFEKTYSDIILQAHLPALKQRDPAIDKLLPLLEEKMGGQAAVEGDRFVMKTPTGTLEFSMVAEGHRKLALLWLLLRNGSIAPGSLLFWDEPEANLNPALIGMVVEILLELSRIGVQIFLATHSYFILKQLDLLMSQNDKVRFITLAKDETGAVAAHVTDDYLLIEPNAISDVFSDLYEQELDRAIKRTGR